MDTNQKSPEKPKSFVDTYGYEPLTAEAMKYWVAATPFHPFFDWTRVCSVAIARKHSLSEAEIKDLIQVDEIDETIGDKCQFPNCGHSVTPLKGQLVNPTTGEPVLDRNSDQPIERGSYVVIFEPANGFVVRLFCPRHAWIARQQEGKKPLPLQSLAAAKDRAGALNDKRAQDRASLEAFKDQTGRRGHNGGGDDERPQGRGRGRGGFRGTGRERQDSRW